MRTLYLIAFILLGTTLSAQDSNSFSYTVESSKAEFLGKTSPISSYKSNLNDPINSKSKFRRDREKPDNFKYRRFQSKAVIPELEFQGPDPIRQTQMGGSVVEPKVNIDGIGDFGSPHDPTGDVGINYYLQAVNVTYVGVFSKDGTLVQQFPMDQLWNEVNGYSLGDPIIIFDEIEERWFITEFTSPANLLIAVSESSDPLGSYYTYSFSTPRFPDYPKYAIWGNKLVVTTNEEGGLKLHQYFLDKQALINGEETASMQRIQITNNAYKETGFYVSTPVDTDGLNYPNDASPITMRLNDSSWGEAEQDQLELYRFDIDFENPDNSTVENISLVTTPYDSYPCSSETGGYACVPQPNGHGLDAIPEIIMNIPKYRNFNNYESIVLSFITDASDGNNLSGIRWMELRRDDQTDWYVYQEGTYSPDDGLDRYMPSIALDIRGNIGLGYSVSSLDVYAGVRYTGRNAGDPKGIMTVEEFNAVDGKNTIYSGGRFGDYAQMGVDPVDGSTFWFTTEYAGEGSQVTQTRIVAFELRKDSVDLSLDKILSPENSSSLGEEESIEVLVRNGGILPISDYDVGYFLDGEYIESMMIPDTLAPDSSKIFMFNTLFDLSPKKAYEIKAFVHHEDDTNLNNDTLNSLVHHLYEYNASIEAISKVDKTCESEVEINAWLTNVGFSEMTDASLFISRNKVIIDTIIWTGLLKFNKTASFSFSVPLELDGENQIDINIASINGQYDENPADNIATLFVDFSASYEDLILSITTDEFPEETTWEILDENQNLVVSGGPYSSPKSKIQEFFCLDTSSCYTFIIRDASGDGFCCSAGLGRYQLFYGEDDLIFESFGNFDFERTHVFCGSGYLCEMAVEYIVENDFGQNDGSIMILAENGMLPYSYSMDGGNNFQDSPYFDNLSAGQYEIITQDNTGQCTQTDTLEIQLDTGIEGQWDTDKAIKILPNPNNGFFQVEYEAPLESGHFLLMQIIDANGMIIQSRKIGKFNNIFKTEVSLVNYPAGKYYIRLLGNDHRKTTSILKY